MQSSDQPTNRSNWRGWGGWGGIGALDNKYEMAAWPQQAPYLGEAQPAVRLHDHVEMGIGVGETAAR